MNPGIVTDAASLALALEPLPAEQMVEGTPRTGFAELTDTIGVWEHTPGVSTDVEADEVFVVLSGSATVSFDDPALEPIELRAGVGRAPHRGHAHGVDGSRDAPEDLHPRLTGARRSAERRRPGQRPADLRTSSARCSAVWVSPSSRSAPSSSSMSAMRW